MLGGFFRFLLEICLRPVLAHDRIPNPGFLRFETLRENVPALIQGVEQFDIQTQVHDFFFEQIAVFQQPLFDLF